jgi:hypothetical protein
VKGEHDPALVNVDYVHEEICISKALVFAAVSTNGLEAEPDTGDRPATAGREQEGTRSA